MRLENRLRRLESFFPSCAGHVRGLLDSESELTEDRRCHVCGQFHYLIIEEEIVTPEQIEQSEQERSRADDRAKPTHEDTP